MPMQEIPRHTWADFFDRFSGQHRGWLVSLDVTGLPSGPQVQASEVSLAWITAELQANRRDRIEVALEACTGEHITYIIPAATHVRLRATEEGAHAGVEIESSAGGTTRIRFRSAMLPQRVDGI
jgi:Family of unknown function (DUF5335)